MLKTRIYEDASLLYCIFHVLTQKVFLSCLNSENYYFCRVLQKTFIPLHKTQRNRNMSNTNNTQNTNNMPKGDINRLKIVLVEQKRTAKWLAEQVGRDPATVSKWCTNIVQPTLETLRQVAFILDVDIRDLICPTK